jgi:hypothetical protein
MRHLISVAVIAAALGAATVAAQTPPAGATPRTVRAIQPGLVEVAGPRVNDAVGAGILKIVATPAKGVKSIEVQSPWGYIYFNWPRNVKQVAFTITTGKAGAAEISAPGYTEANKADYRAALEAVVPLAISKAQAQKHAKTNPPY